jgi:hypothetical protein
VISDGGRGGSAEDALPPLDRGRVGTPILKSGFPYRGDEIVAAGVAALGALGARVVRSGIGELGLGGGEEAELVECCAEGDKSSVGVSSGALERPCEEKEPESAMGSADVGRA